MIKKIETIAFLKAQAASLEAVGENKLAKQMFSRIKVLEAQLQRAKVKSKNKVVVLEPEAEVQMVFSEGRVYFKTPYPGSRRLFAFKESLKAASLDNVGQTNAKWIKKLSMWSFPATPSAIIAVKQVIANFFSNATLVNENGESVGSLPKSNYVAG